MHGLVGVKDAQAALGVTAGAPVVIGPYKCFVVQNSGVEAEGIDAVMIMTTITIHRT